MHLLCERRQKERQTGTAFLILLDMLYLSGQTLSIIKTMRFNLYF